MSTCDKYDLYLHSSPTLILSSVRPSVVTLLGAVAKNDSYKNVNNVEVSLPRITFKYY